jgi:hypothetical protein
MEINSNAPIISRHEIHDKRAARNRMAGSLPRSTAGAIGILTLRRTTSKEELARLYLTEVGRLLDAGKLTCFVDAVMPFALASDAYCGNSKG